MAWYKVADTASAFTIKKVNAGGKNICLIHYNNQYYATQAKCPHAGGDLTSGWCADGKLICPLHRYAYDLQSGRGSERQGDYVNIYSVKVDNGEIFVKVDSLFERIQQLFTHGT